jgi:3-oxoacyl-[acyl-carrier protein] reductase
MKPDNKNNSRPVAIVTGGTRGIGAACCRQLSSRGFRIGVGCRQNRDKGHALLNQEGVDGFLLEADLADTDQVEQMVKEIQQQAGRVDVLVNNAGFSVNNIMAAMKLSDFDRQRSILRGTWYLVKRVLRRFMLRQRSGRIINMSSVTAFTGNAGQIPYTMEKGALDAMTRSLSRELAGRNILVNSVAPGFIDTDMTRALPNELGEAMLASIPLKRMGTPDEVAEVVSFLATGGSYINGSVLHVNGGMYGG